MKIATLAEITTADGLSIERKFWKGEQNEASTLLWPQQPNPMNKLFQFGENLSQRLFSLTQKLRLQSTDTT